MAFNFFKRGLARQVAVSSPSSTTTVMETLAPDLEHEADRVESPSHSGDGSMHYPDNRPAKEECPVCHMFEDISKPIPLSRHYWDCTLVELKNAASQNGCIQCQPLYELIKLFVPDGSQGRNHINISPLWDCELFISSGVRKREQTYELDIFRLHEPSSTNCKLLKEVPIKNLCPGNTGSKETLKCIKRWIRECDSEHSLCAPTRHSAQLHGPKRILDLRFGKVRLREDHQDEYSYACLSHCWGNGAAVPKTVATTLELFKKNIPLKILTQTFRDAIDLCRRLEIHFLWIDSLCIQQDDEEDWKSQAPKMAGIYENAILTIAATMSVDGSGGLYSKAKHRNYLSADGLSVREKFPAFPKSEHSSLEAWPLLQRGWVYQERKLSRRMIHFGVKEVVWECQSHIARESKVSFEPVRTRGYDPLSDWTKHVEAYSELQLTFEKDKLVALAGIAERTAKFLRDDRYIAGLWENDLLLNLTWYSFDTLSLAARPSTFCVPTWSWASIKTAVSWHVNSYSVVEGVEVVDVSCPTTYTGNVCSEYDGNSGLRPTITIRGPMMAARFSPGTFVWPRHWRPRTDDDQGDYYREVTFLGEHAPPPDSFLRVSFKPDYLFHKPGRYYVEPDSELFVLPFVFSQWGLNGLLLQKREGTPFYERLGWVSIDHSKSRAHKQSLDTHISSLPLSDITII